MHIERLTIEAGDATFSLDLHPSFTVIAGVGPAERRGLIAEMLGALGDGRPGVHLELQADSGTRYGLLRPVNGPPRVISLARGIDVTEAFRSADGTVDVLARVGLSTRSAKKVLRLTEVDLTTRSQFEQNVLTLAHLDQGRLWDVARKVTEREQAVAEATAAVSSDPEDAAIFQEIERRHAAFEQAEEAHERVRRISLLVGANAAVGIVPLAGLFGLVGAAPALAVAMAMTVYSATCWRRMEAARRHEQEALQAAGAQSYLAFQINKVNGLVADDRQRRQLMRLAEFHRAALAEWQLLAGDIPVEWALEHRAEIRDAAERLRSAVEVRNPMAVRLSPDEETAADLAHALLHRLNHLRTLAGGESLPLFLDEPFPQVDATVKAELLELLMKASREQQVILLTEDEDVASWARLEAMTGGLSIVEPNTVAEDRTGGGKAPSSKHVAA